MFLKVLYMHNPFFFSYTESQLIWKKIVCGTKVGKCSCFRYNFSGDKYINKCFIHIQQSAIYSKLKDGSWNFIYLSNINLVIPDHDRLITCLLPCDPSAGTNTTNRDEEPVQIAWSSSDSEQSDSGAQMEPVQIAWSSSHSEQSDTEAQKEPVQIAWSSSDSEQSNSEAQKQPLPRVPMQPQQRPRRRERLVCPIQSYTRALRLLCTNKGNL